MSDFNVTLISGGDCLVGASDLRLPIFGNTDPWVSLCQSRLRRLRYLLMYDRISDLSLRNCRASSLTNSLNWIMHLSSSVVSLVSSYPHGPILPCVCVAGVAGGVSAWESVRRLSVARIALVASCSVFVPANTSSNSSGLSLLMGNGLLDGPAANA
jgi:hypothetical protein